MSSIRNSFWHQLSQFHCGGMPWAIIGDFHVVLSPEEKLGGDPFRESAYTRSLQQFLFSQGLLDLGFSAKVDFTSVTFILSIRKLLFLLPILVWNENNVRLCRIILVLNDSLKVINLHLYVRNWNSSKIMVSSWNYLVFRNSSFWKSTKNNN